MIAPGSSERGLSEVTTTWSASAAAAAPMSGRLARSRSPPAPKTHDDAARRQPARGAQHVLERVRRVGVVDEHREGLALVDRLEAARAPAGPGQRRRRSPSSPTPSARAEATAQRALSTLKRPGSGDARARASPARKRRARRARAQVGRAQVGVGALEADGHRVGELRGQPQPVRVVDVDDADRGRALGEEPALGLEVVLHVGVEVEVVLREVREHRDVPVDGVGARERERVGGDLHDARPRRRRRASRRTSRWRSIASGVVRTASSRRRPTIVPTVPSRPVRSPPASSSARTRKAVVVLPFVPVMPTRPQGGGRVAARARRRPAPSRGARRRRGPRGRRARAGAATTRATAPRATASGAKSCPSRVKPGTQKNSAPGSTRAGVVGERGHLDVARSAAPAATRAPGTTSASSISPGA